MSLNNSPKQGHSSTQPTSSEETEPKPEAEEVVIHPGAPTDETHDYLVFHNLDEQTMFQVEPRLWEESNQACRLVALVEAHSLEEAYRLTNHIDGDWRENALVKSVSDTPPRSTSVGDVITARQQIWLVDRVGFRFVGGQVRPSQD